MKIELPFSLSKIYSGILLVLTYRREETKKSASRKGSEARLLNKSRHKKGQTALVAAAHKKSTGTSEFSNLNFTETYPVLDSYFYILLRYQ
ncbi:hypothetical protein CWO92_11890 [Heyndrickxia camelliae]|uniref:Uncharacterized protein n=1 Tax=Heyndrickxia camelliae TaxID=1707093 RepID=A0A2N3LJC9_9BACI|nr:hypothetical protein CWO92_11890 [Heyndrickxia camelliae]